MQKECIILAGGLGTRLKSISGDTPKPLVTVANRPFIFHILDRLIDEGFQHLILATSYLSNMVESTLGHNYRGVKISYSIEAEPLGTGGAIAQALSVASSENVLVVNGDTYVDISLDAFYKKHIASNKDVTLALINVPDTTRYGRVKMNDDTIESFLEKGESGPGCINGGVYWIKRTALSGFPVKFSFEELYLRMNISMLGGFKCDGYFIDIGIPEDYYRACEHFKI